MSKMQPIVDRIRDANKACAYGEAIEAILEAIKLLSKAQQQTIGDIESMRLRPPSDQDIPIGSE